jgi:nitroimidazol reductase NimA-like FMN-containing flavoprotein (pyridoxamine 5'-phosphate oxidase superfamily)
MKTTAKPSDRVRVRRLPKRARYDWESIRAILDAAFLCHVGYVIDRQPFVTPTCYWRYDKQVLLHGSFASRMLNTAAKGIDVCVTVSIVDGLVLARSGFHHSINYRAAMLFGRARALADEAEKRDAMEAFVERFYPGRWPTLRPLTRKELKATTVLVLDVDEASAKVRTGPPIDDEEDYALPIWAGVIPVASVQLPALPDSRLSEAVGIPAHLGDLSHLGLIPRTRL